MGIFIMLTAFVVEIAFAAFCIITKSNQQKARSIVRIATFICFLLFTFLSVIEWSVRYYALTGLLLLLAIIAAVNLIRKKEEKRIYKIVRVIFKAIGMTALFFIVALPAVVFPQHKAIEPTGKYSVSTVDYTYTDANRIETYTQTGENRKLNVKFWYPEDADGRYPLVVFSHGGLGVKTSNQTLYHELASHGYVVCSIDHTYQCFFTTDENGHTTLIDMDYMQELSHENARADRQQSYECYQKWMTIRTGDINFVIDTILAKVKSNDADRTYGLIDETKIGVMGHSLGGAAALGMGRMREDVGAVIALESPFLCDIEGVRDGEFVFKDAPYPVPVLSVYSDSSWGILAHRPQYAQNAALLTAADRDAFNAYIKGSYHLTLTDLALTSPFLTRVFNGKKSAVDTVYCLETINRICLEFFDCYLKGKGVFVSDGTY